MNVLVSPESIIKTEGRIICIDYTSFNRMFSVIWILCDLMSNETSSQKLQTCMLLRHFTQIYYIISTGWSYHWTTQAWKYNQRVSGHGRWDSTAPKWRVLILINFPCSNVFGFFVLYKIGDHEITPLEVISELHHMVYAVITISLSHQVWTTAPLLPDTDAFITVDGKTYWNIAFFEFYFDSYQCIPEFDSGHFLCNSIW